MPGQRLRRRVSWPLRRPRRPASSRSGRGLDLRRHEPTGGLYRYHLFGRCYLQFDAGPDRWRGAEPLRDPGSQRTERRMERVASLYGGRRALGATQAPYCRHCTGLHAQFGGVFRSSRPFTGRSAARRSALSTIQRHLLRTASIRSFLEKLTIIRASRICCPPACRAIGRGICHPVQLCLGWRHRPEHGERAQLRISLLGRYTRARDVCPPRERPSRPLPAPPQAGGVELLGAAPAPEAGEREEPRLGCRPDRGPGRRVSKEAGRRQAPRNCRKPHLRPQKPGPPSWRVSTMSARQPVSRHRRCLPHRPGLA